MGNASNASGLRYRSNEGCTVYYNEGIGLSPPAVSPLQASWSPEKLRLAKSTQVLEYENALLAKQLQ